MCKDIEVFSGSPFWRHPFEFTQYTFMRFPSFPKMLWVSFVYVSLNSIESSHQCSGLKFIFRCFLGLDVFQIHFTIPSTKVGLIIASNNWPTWDASVVLEEDKQTRMLFIINQTNIQNKSLQEIKKCSCLLSRCST